MKTTIAVAFAGALLAGSAHAEEDRDDARPAFLDSMPRPTVKRVSATGEGCPVSSAVSASFSGDASRLTLRFGEGQMTARVGPGIPTEDVLSACELQLVLGIPRGYRVAIQQATYQGFADMDPGTLAFHSTRYWFLGTRAPARMATLQGGKSREPYTLNASFGPTAVSSFCGSQRPLFINVAVGVTTLGNPSRHAMVVLGGRDREVSYRLDWTQCPSE
ncbi:DUF4360 domain-containing protein [Chondromyces crocatus]|nr:DUF4360 domain-containing protein [Chondromyces crocatus]